MLFVPKPNKRCSFHNVTNSPKVRICLICDDTLQLSDREEFRYINKVVNNICSHTFGIFGLPVTWI